MKIICIGLNYRKHALELGWSIPEEPVVFLKPDSALLKKNKPFLKGFYSDKTQFSYSKKNWLLKKVLYFNSYLFLIAVSLLKSNK